MLNLQRTQKRRNYNCSIINPYANRLFNNLLYSLLFRNGNRGKSPASVVIQTTTCSRITCKTIPNSNMTLLYILYKEDKRTSELVVDVGVVMNLYIMMLHFKTIRMLI